MLDAKKVAELVERGESLMRRGVDVTLRKLCEHCPEYEAEVGRQLSKRQAKQSEIETKQTEEWSKKEPPASTLFDHVEIPGYEIGEKLGEGGMGVVYSAIETDTKRTVAIKTLKGKPHKEAVTRFRTEARALKELEHEHIAKVFDIGEHNGVTYYVMEFVEGGSLHDKLGGKPLNAAAPNEAAELIKILAAAMHKAHEKGFIHRDLKPANFLLTKEGVPKVADFGLAKNLEAEESLTPTEAAFGTPSYMAPEQASGRSKEATRSADVYSLGATLFELLTGKPPFKGANKLDTLQMVIHNEPPRPSSLQKGIPPVLEAVCLKCLEKKPEKRYSTAEDLAADITGFLNDQPTIARPPSLATKTLRWCVGHPIAMSGAAVVLMIVAALAAAYLAHPYRNVERALADLEAGRKVTLIGKSGPPKWFEWVVGKKNANMDFENELSITSANTALVELLPTIPCREFSMSFEVRHFDCHEDGVGGIYFGGERRTNQGGKLRYFCYELSYSDFLKQSNGRMDLELLLSSADLEGAHTKKMEIIANMRRFGFVRPPPWRKISIVIRAGEIQVFDANNGRNMGNAKTGFIEKTLGPTFLSINSLDEFRPNFSFSGAFGLYVHRGSAMYRNIVIEPK